MAKEICISTTPHETRLAILEDDQLAEIYYERENEYTLAGSIYKGRVTRVLPGMQSSFVDVGLERDAFLYVTDFLEEQEDGEEYTSEGNGSGRREGRSHPEPGEETQIQARAAIPERNGDRNGERHQDRNPDRNSDRNQDRGRRSARVVAAPQPAEGGRARREQVREQAVAPLREAVPDAQDLEEKGDGESPEGTRRWRGRRGRRKGVRGGLPRSEARPSVGDSREDIPDEFPEAHEGGGAATVFPIIEHGAPGGIATLHGSRDPEEGSVFDSVTAASARATASTGNDAPRNRGGRDSQGQQGRAGHGRGERETRRSREPYAQVSTLDEPLGESERSPWGSWVPAAKADGPKPAPGVLAAGGAIVLPGESISKYGSAPADPSSPASPVAATAPKSVRPVNYVAPKPSTLVELPVGWDGGAVLPGESISRYRDPASQTAASGQSRGLSIEPESALELESDSYSDEPVHSVIAESAVDDAAEPALHPAVHPEDHDLQPELNALPAEKLLAAEHVSAVVVSATELAPLAAPELVAQTLPAEDEASTIGFLEPDSDLAAPVAGSSSPKTAENAAELEPAPGVAVEPAEPGEYEPENASVSYRVQRSGPRELRLPSPEADEASPDLQPAEASVETVAQLQTETGAAALTEVNAHQPEPESRPEAAGSVPELHGVLAAPGAVAETGESTPHLLYPFDENLTATGRLEPVSYQAGVASSTGHPAPLQILHEDGRVDLAASSEPSGWVEPQYAPYAARDAETHHVASQPIENTEEESIEAPAYELSPVIDPVDSHIYAGDHDRDHVGEPVDASIPDYERGHEPDREAYRQPDHGRTQLETAEFSELVDRLQGFAPGLGLLEEETIDEDEYDFEPMHLHGHGEDGDQEDLEEETLDHQIEVAALSEAVRDSHLEQRVHGQRLEDEPVAEHRVQRSFEQSRQEPAAYLGEEGEPHARFGYEEVEESDDELDELAEDGEGEDGESARSAQPGEPRRSAEDRSRGRGRSGGRNSGRRNGPGRGRSAQTQDLPIISDLLKQGQEILVQIAKEPIAKKGARITSHIALPGRFLVFMPTVSHIGVSRKIASDEERQRLKRILVSEKGESGGGFIVRTAAEGASEEDLRADLRFLISLWTEIKQRSDSAKAPALIYHDLNLIERILRDQVSSNFSTIWVDSESEYERIIRFLNRFQPQLVRRVKLYTKETPLFEHFGIQEEISKALKSKVWLKSGGSIVINQTEALVAIDINTGKYVGKTARLEDTIVKTNLDAIPEIVRQIRLRDLGGIIVIDFIDMDERKNRNRVLAALEEELKNDRAPSKVLQFNDFGLVAITRKRVKQSLERTLSVTCETCTGTGMVKSPITVCNEIYIEMRKMIKHLDGKDVMLRVNPEVVKQLKSNNGKWINELEEMVAKTIIIKSDPALHPEQFDIH